VLGVFLVMLAAAVLVRYSGLFASVVDWDESLYAVMAENWLHGALPYDAVWDQHSIGLPALFALILSVFPKSIIALRLSACVAVAVTATSLYFTTRLFDRRALVAAVVVTLYLGWTSRLWGLAANTEIYLNALIAPAMYWVMRDMATAGRGRGAMGRACAAALLFGLALQIKHVVIAETALFIGAFGLSQFQRTGAVPWRLLAAVGGCIILPTAVVIAYFYVHGLANEYIRAVFDSNLVYAIDRPSLSKVLDGFPRSLTLIVAAAITGLAMVVRRPSRAGILLSAWAIAAGVDVALPGQFWPHYFLLMAAPAALLAGFVIARIHLRWTAVAAAGVAAATLLLINPLGIVHDAMKVREITDADAPRAIAERIGRSLGPDDSIFVVNYQPVIYLLSDADVPTRHVFPADWSRRFLAVSGLDPVRELDAVFAKQPNFVVFIEPDWLNMGDEMFTALRGHLAGSYEKAFEVEDRQILVEPVPVQVYRRKAAQG
jgi:hypothetical protein